MMGEEPPSASDLSPPPPPDRLELDVCECGVVRNATLDGLVACGRQRSIIMGRSCETTRCVYELVPYSEVAP